MLYASNLVLIASALLLAIPAQGQKPSPRLTAASQSQDLEFPAEASSFSNFSSPRMALYKPDGAGPFPALILLHQCAGLTGGYSRTRR